MKTKRSAKAIVSNKEFLGDFLSGAFYDSPWARALIYEDTPNVPHTDACACYEDKLADILLNGHAIKVVDNEEGGEYSMSLNDIVKGFKRLMFDEPRHYADIMTDEADLWSWDALLQIIIFGEVIYG